MHIRIVKKTNKQTNTQHWFCLIILLLRLKVDPSKSVRAYRDVPLSNCQSVRGLSRRLFETFMPTFHKSAFLQTLPTKTSNKSLKPLWNFFLKTLSTFMFMQICAPVLFLCKCLVFILFFVRICVIYIWFVCAAIVYVKRCLIRAISGLRSLSHSLGTWRQLM